MNQSVHCWDIVTTDLTENEKKRPEIHELSRNIDKKVQIVMELIPGLSKITAEIIVAYAYAINTTSNALRKLQNGDMIIASHLFFRSTDGWKVLDQVCEANPFLEEISCSAYEMFDLYNAAEYGAFYVAKYFIRKGANFKGRSTTGPSILSVAKRSFSKRKMNILHDLIADVEMKNKPESSYDIIINQDSLNMFDIMGTKFQHMLEKVKPQNRIE